MRIVGLFALYSTSLKDFLLGSVTPTHICMFSTPIACFYKPFKEPVIEPGEIDSLESIIGLLKPLQIRAQRYKLDQF